MTSEIISSEKESCFYYLNKILDNISRNKYPSVNNKEINYENCIGIIQKCIKFDQDEVINLFNKYSISIDFFKEINPLGFSANDCKSFGNNIIECDKYIKISENKFIYYTFRPIGIPVKVLYFVNQIDMIFINGQKYNGNCNKTSIPKSLIENLHTNVFLINNKIFSINGWLYLNYDKVSNYFSEFRKIFGTSEYIAKLNTLIANNLIDQFDFAAYRVQDAQYNNLDPNVIYSPYTKYTNFDFVGRYHLFPNTLIEKDKIIETSKKLKYPTDTLMFYDGSGFYNRFVFCNIPLNVQNEDKQVENTQAVVENFINKCSDIYHNILHYFICNINNTPTPVYVNNPKVLVENKISKGAVISYIKKGNLYYFKELISEGNQIEYYSINESNRKITYKNKLTLISSEENKNLSLLNRICIFLNMLEVEDLSDIIYKLICSGKINKIVDLFYLREKDFETNIEALEFACKFTKNENKFISTNIDGYLTNYKHSLYFWQVLYLYVNNLSVDKARIISYQFNEIYILEKLTDEVIKQVSGVNVLNFSKSIQDKKEEIYCLINKINIKQEYKNKEYKHIVLQKTFGYYNVFKKLLTNLGYLVLGKPIDSIKYDLIYVYEKNMNINTTDYITPSLNIKSIYQLLKKYTHINGCSLDNEFFQKTLKSYGFVPNMFLGVVCWYVKNSKEETYIEIVCECENNLKVDKSAISTIIRAIPELASFNFSFIFKYVKSKEQIFEKNIALIQCDSYNVV